MPSRRSKTLCRRALAIALALVALGLGTADADTVKLDNGDSLTGTVKSFASGSLVLSTTWGGDISIKSANIVALSTEKPFIIRWKDGSERVARLGIGKSGEIEILPPDDGIAEAAAAPAQADEATTGSTETALATATSAQTDKPAPASTEPKESPAVYWEMEQVRQANQAAREADAELGLGETLGATNQDLKLSDVQSIDPLTPYFRYTGNLNVGLSRVRGNSNTSDINIDGQLEPSIGLNTLILYGQIVRSFADDALTESTWRLRMSYNRFFGATDRWYIDISNRYYSDELADLDLRIQASAGIGYKFFTAKPTILSASIGPSYTHERYTDDQPIVQYGGLTLDYDFKQDIWNTGLNLYSTGDITGGLTGKQLVLTTRSGIQMPVIKQLALSAEVQWTYNMEPAADAVPSDQTYTLKLGYKFSGDENDWFKGW